MRLLRNKIFIAVVCLLVSGLIVWQVSKYAESSKDTVTVLKLTTVVEPNVEIKENMIRQVEIGKFNMPAKMITDKADIIGKYAAVTIYPDDILLKEKFKVKADLPDQFLYEIKDNRVAVSVSVRSLAAGVSGKLKQGDVISVLVYKKGDFQGTAEESEGEVLEYPDLKYVEIGAINNSKAEDLGVTANEKAKDATATDTIIPATVTLLVTESQAKTLIMAENTGTIHLVFRGRGETAKTLLAQNGEAKPVEQAPVTENIENGNEKTEETKTEEPKTEEKTAETNVNTQEVDENDFNIG